LGNDINIGAWSNPVLKCFPLNSAKNIKD